MAKPSPERRKIGRREFTLSAAAAATAAIVRPAESLAQASQQQAATPLAEDAQKAQAALKKLGVQSRAEVEMKANNIYRKYGDRLTAAQKADILRALAEGQEGLEKMRAFALNNADQPATVFRPQRKEGKR